MTVDQRPRRWAIRLVDRDAWMGRIGDHTHPVAPGVEVSSIELGPTRDPAAVFCFTFEFANMVAVGVGEPCLILEAPHRS